MSKLSEVTTGEALSIIYSGIPSRLTDIEAEFRRYSEIDEDKARGLINRMFNIPDDATTDEKGKSLENLVDYLLEKSNLFQNLYSDIRFNFCQVDHAGVFLPEVWAIFFQAHKKLRDENHRFAGESKRYGSALGVTYVLKFECVKYIRDIKFGAYFTRKGITGDDYNDSKEVLRRLFTSDQQFSIVFKDDDWESIYKDPKGFGFLFYQKVQDFLNKEEI